jgi:hypothetical protein
VTTISGTDVAVDGFAFCAALFAIPLAKIAAASAADKGARRHG